MGEFYPRIIDKLSVLEFIHQRDGVRIFDLVERFGYAYRGAQWRLSTLIKQRLIKRIGWGEYCLAEDGYSRLAHYHKL